MHSAAMHHHHSAHVTEQWHTLSVDSREIFLASTDCCVPCIAQPLMSWDTAATSRRAAQECWEEGSSGLCTC